MASNKKQIEFTAKNVKAFSNWLTKFSAVDNSLLLEIDQAQSLFIAKTYNEEHSVVKMSAIRFDDAGLTTKLGKDSKRIKVGIYNIPRLIKVMNQFNDVEFTITVEYQDLIGDGETQYAAEKFLFKNKNLKMNIDCTSLNIFKYMPDDLFKNNIATVDAIGVFELTKTNIEKISTLNTLDSEHKFLSFSIKENNTYVAGKAFDLLIGDNTSSDTAELTIFKEQYSALDVENYEVQMSDDRLVFTSKDSDTTCVISRAEDKD